MKQSTTSDDPELQKYIKMAIANAAVAPQLQKRQGGGVLGFLWGLLLITMISTFLVLAAPKAIELYLWYREGMPVADHPAAPTSAPQLPTARVPQPPPYTAPVVIVQQQPAQPAQEAQPPDPPADAKPDEGVKPNTRSYASGRTEQQTLIIYPAATPQPGGLDVHVGSDGASVSITNAEPTSEVEYRAQGKEAIEPPNAKGSKPNTRSYK